MIDPMEKEWFMAPVYQIILRWKRHYGANGIYPLVYSFNGKGVVL